MMAPTMGNLQEKSTDKSRKDSHCPSESRGVAETTLRNDRNNTKEYKNAYCRV
jgi:hypothetical protein